MAVNKNDELRKLHTYGDQIADQITLMAGSTPFLFINGLVFIVWLLINGGYFGLSLVFDPFPFSLLTTVVSLEAIVLSIFVLISQNRQSRIAMQRTELDYRADLESEADVETLVRMLERIAARQDVDVSDLVHDLQAKRRKVLRDNPVTK